MSNQLSPLLNGIQPNLKIINLKEVRDFFSYFLKNDWENKMYNSKYINYYQFFIKRGEIQCLDEGFKNQIKLFEKEGLKLYKTLEIKLEDEKKKLVEYIKLHIYRSNNHNKFYGGIRDGLACSLGYFPSDNEITITEVKFKS
jgi:hypothetical protein